jgi:hypothetical protein
VHVGSADRLADRLRVLPIVLVGLHIGRDELRTDQPDIVTKFGNRLRPKVSTVRSDGRDRFDTAALWFPLRSPCGPGAFSGTGRDPTMAA